MFSDRPFFLPCGGAGKDDRRNRDPPPEALLKKPLIVVLDGHTLNPGDLSWEALSRLGELTIHKRTPPEKVVERAKGAEAVLTNKVVLSRAVIKQLPHLRYVGIMATGVNVVDLSAAGVRGVMVTNVPAYSTDSVAQLTFALLLELCHHAGDHALAVQEGEWSASADFSFHLTPQMELAGLAMGIVGFGRIGEAVSRRAIAFGMEVLVHTRNPHAKKAPHVRFVGLEELFARSDVVSLHCQLTDETRGLVDARRLALMKKTAFLLNTARGPLVDEKALAKALNEGRIAGAGLDVLSREPPPPDHPLLTARNCVITPHMAWATLAARERLMEAVVANLSSFLAGKPQNVVRG